MSCQGPPLSAKTLNAAEECALCLRVKVICVLPDFFAGPFPSPFQGRDRMPAGRAERRLDLDKVADAEPAPAQQPDHVAMADVELHRVAAQPLEAVHAEAGPLQRFGGRPVVLVQPGQDDLDRAGQEDQLPPGRSTRAASGIQA